MECVHDSYGDFFDHEPSKAERLEGCERVEGRGHLGFFILETGTFMGGTKFFSLGGRIPTQIPFCRKQGFRSHGTPHRLILDVSFGVCPPTQTFHLGLFSTVEIVGCFTRNRKWIVEYYTD
eukprot:14414742-Ditylum_brightwellii.AAC.1